MSRHVPAQRGQAMSEFIIALAVLVPMFLAVTYLGRYGDLQQRATQASRYAAAQRAMQPEAAKLTDDKIADQMRARFFLAPSYLVADGHLRSDDSVAKVKDDLGQPALWRDIGGKALLKDPAQVSLQWGNASMGAADKSVGYVAKLVGKSYSDGRVAMVELNLFNRLNLADSNPANLKIGAATAVAGNGLGSSGSQATTDSVSKLVPADWGWVRPILNKVSAVATWLFEKDTPDFGCIKPDVVAAQDATTSRLDAAPNNSACLH